MKVSTKHVDVQNVEGAMEGDSEALEDNEHLVEANDDERAHTHTHQCPGYFARSCSY
jgi:hypothetical protein